MRNTTAISGNPLWCLARLLICSTLLSTATLQAGTLFVTVEGTGQILQFTSSGVPSTFASGLNVPVGLAFDGSGNLYEADSNYPNFGNGVIYKFTPGGVRSTFASGLGDPVSLAVDANGNVYVGDDYDQNIYKFTPGGIRSTFASSVYPAGLAFDGAGNLYEADSGFAVNSMVGRINEFTPNGTQSIFATGLGYPVGLAFDASGNLYASDAHLGVIFEFTSGGAESTFASGLSSAGFLAFDGSGNLFAVDQTGFIYEFNPSGIRSTFASGLSGPVGLAFRASGFMLGDAANFVVLYEGNGSHQLSTTNVTISGNIGIGDPSGNTTAYLAASGGNPAAINGNILYAGAVSPNNRIQNTTFTGTVTGGNANVQADLNALNTLSTALGEEMGTELSVNLNNNQSQTINASDGVLDVSGDRVFSVSSFSFNNGATLTINGDAAGDSVVLNFASNVQFGGTILLTGISSDQVLFNITGGSGLRGGPTLQINTNSADLTGTFLDPNGAVSIVHSVLNGRVFGGDSSNMQIVSGDTLTAP